ncbi:MAG TPA: ComEC/Rec2 family competence protein [Candidatus Dormibacteraeota bacterium]
MSRLLPPTHGSRVLAALAATLAAGVIIGARTPQPRGPLAVVIGAGLGLVTLALCRRSRRVAVIGGALVLGAAGALRGVSAVPAHAHPATGATIIRGSVRDIPVPHGGETVVVLDVDALAPPSPGIASVALAIPGRTDLLPGDRVEVQATGLRSPGGRPGPLSAAVLDRGGVDAVAVSPRVTVTARGSASLSREVAHARAGITSTLQASVAEPQATLVGAVAFGIRGRLPTALDNDLRDSGLFHLVATSGLKVAIVAGLMARLLALMVLGPRIRLASTLAVVGSYVVLAGGGAAATRSALMGGVTLSLAGTGRRAEPLPLLALVAALLLVVDPRVAGDAGFQLTFLGTLGIVALAAPIAGHIPGPRLLVEPFAVTLAAQAATVPVMAATFGGVSLVGPIANALAVPLVPPLLALATLGVALSTIAPWLGWPALQGAGLLGWGIAQVAHLAAAVPGAAVHVAEWPAVWTAAEAVLVSALVLGHRLWRGPRPAASDPPPAARSRPRLAGDRPRRLALAGAVLVGLSSAGALAAGAARPDGRLHVSVLASGSGPAVLVRTSLGGLALVDAGADPQQLLVALGAAVPLFTRTLDEVILTGGERGAIGGLADLAAHFGVAHVVVPDADLGTAGRAVVLALREAGAEVDVVPLGSAWQWSGAAWRCIPAGAQDGGASAQALCALQVRDGDAGALLLGDLAPPAQEEVVAGAGDGLRSDLVVAPPTGLLAPTLLTSAGAHLLAIPGTRTLRSSVATAYPGVAVRGTGSDGTVGYATGVSGALEPA